MSFFWVADLINDEVVRIFVLTHHRPAPVAPLWKQMKMTHPTPNTDDSYELGPCPYSANTHNESLGTQLPDPMPPTHGRRYGFEKACCNWSSTRSDRAID